MNFVISSIIQKNSTTYLHQTIVSARNEEEAVGKYIMELKDVTLMSVPLTVSQKEIEYFIE